MSHDANGGLSAPIDVQGDLAYVFGISSGDVGTIFQGARTNVNKWAKYKPVRHSNPGILSNAERASVNYGLSLSGSARSSAAATLSDYWDYAYPNGGSTQWYRVLDFDGYNPLAPAPCAPIGDITIALSSSSEYSFGAAISHSPSGGDSVAWADLSASIADYYLCVIFSTGANCTGNLIGKTSSQKVSDSGVTLDITNAELNTLYSNGYKYYYLCACSASNSASQTLSNPSGWTSRSYLALPTDNGTSDVNGKFTIEASSIANLVISKVNASQSPSRATVFLSAANFRGAESITPSQSDYFNCPSVSGYHYIHFGVDITAGSSSVTIGSISIKMSQTFISGSGFSNAKSVTLRDSSFNQQSQVTIPAGTTQTVYLVASIPLMSLNSAGQQVANAPDGHFSTVVSFIQNGVQIGSDEIRLRNYSF